MASHVNIYLKFIILFLFINYPNVALAISERDYDILMKDARIESADYLLNKSWFELKTGANKEQLKTVLEDQRKWLASDRDKEADYVMDIDSSLEINERYLIVILARYSFINYIIKYIKKYDPDKYQLLSKIDNYDIGIVLLTWYKNLLGGGYIGKVKINREYKPNSNSDDKTGKELENILKKLNNIRE